MPSPVGHTLAGLCGFLLAKHRVAPSKQGWLLVISVVIANVPDFDALSGLLLGDPRIFHHQGTHSFAAVVMVGLSIGGIAGWRKLDRTMWALWGGGLYLSHAVLDSFVNDPNPPFGVQLLWPFSETYFISPITPFAPFDYFDPVVGVIGALFSFQNIVTMLGEIILMSPLVGVAWYVGKNRS